MPQTREQVQGLNGNHAFDGLLSSTALLAWVLTASKASNAVAAIMVRSPMRMSASSPPVYSNLSTTWRQEKRERERECERERERALRRSGRSNFRVSGCRLTFCAKRLARPAAVGAQSLRSGSTGSGRICALQNAALLLSRSPTSPSRRYLSCSRRIRFLLPPPRALLEHIQLHSR